MDALQVVFTVVAVAALAAVIAGIVIACRRKGASSGKQHLSGNVRRYEIKNLHPSAKRPTKC